MSLDLQNLDTTSRKVIELRAYVDAGKSFAWIRKRMRLTRGQLDYLKHKAGLAGSESPLKKVVDDKYEKLYARYEQEKYDLERMPLKQLAELLGVSLSTLRRRFRKVRERQQDGTER